MNYLGIDYGEKRIGLAAGDDLGVAVPIRAAVEGRAEERMAHILRVLHERRVDEIVIGYPYNMDGSVGFKAREVDAFIDQLQKQTELPIHRLDERLTSHTAEMGLRATGRKRSRQDRKSGDLDSRAAAIILQDFLDARTADGEAWVPEDDAE